MRKLFAQRASAWGPGLQPCVSLSGEEFVVDLLITHWCKLLQACTLGWCWSFKRWQIVSIFLCFHVKILMRTFWPLWRKLHMQSFKSTETPVLWPPHVKSWLTGKGGIGDRRKRGRQRMRWLDGITDSMDVGFHELQSWCWTGRPGVLQFLGSQRVGHDWATELNCTEHMQTVRLHARAKGRQLLFSVLQSETRFPSPQAPHTPFPVQLSPERPSVCSCVCRALVFSYTQAAAHTPLPVLSATL